MTRPALPITAAFLFGALTVPALAQGTDEQREACAPDAVRLCQDTIPDVDRTTACMKRHEAQLSPRCRTVFNAATGGGTGTARRNRDNRDEYDGGRRSARVSPDQEDDAPGVRSYRYLSPEGREAEAPDEEDVDRARAAISRLCDDDRLDPGTCAVTRQGLDNAR